MAVWRRGNVITGWLAEQDKEIIMKDKQKRGEGRGGAMAIPGI